MNKFYFVLLVFVLIGCKKSENLHEDNRCTNFVVDNPDSLLLTSLQIDTIHYLFTRNHIDITGLQFWTYNESQGNRNILFRNIGAYQFVNGLKVFTDYWGFEFGDGDTLINIGGDTITNINLPSKPRLMSSQVRWIFINEMRKDGFYKNSIEIQNSCIDMEFGYYDLNSGYGNRAKKYTSAWKVNPHNLNFPFAYIDDLKGKLIYYFNGIMTK